MNQAYTIYPVPCEKDSPFRHGPLWPKIICYPTLRVTTGHFIPWPIPITAHFHLAWVSRTPDTYSFG
jgi:hypothetical protein